MRYRPLVLRLGVAALVVGLVAIGYPGLVTFGLDRLLLSAVGVVALALALRVVQARRHGALDEATTPDPELPAATPSPGDDLAAVLDQFPAPDGRSVHRTRVRGGLHAAAVAVLVAYGGYSEAEAAERVRDGTWTDDPSAIAFLAWPDAPTLPLRTRLGDALARESRFQRRVRHTVDAIAAAAGVTPRSTDDSADTPRRREVRRAGGDDAALAGFSTPAGHEFDDGAASVVSRALHPTGHWRGVGVVALAGIGVGVLAEQPAVLLSGVLGVGFAAYARSAALPPGDVSVDRTLDVTRPEPGDDVEVTVTVTNGSDRFLPDLRFVDGVPETLGVASGSPRLGTALRPGERATFTYTVTARRGVHPFGPTLLVARDLSGAREEERLLAAETTLTCLPSLRPLAEPVPLRSRATRQVGRVETASGGDGVEFHATREYRSGDPLSRIDWNRRARTGELTTVEFREERAATVVVVVDAREAAHVSPTPHAPPAVDRAADAAGRLFATLSDAGNRVGIAALGSASCWLAPGAGADHRVEARELLGTHPALSAVPGRNRPSTVRWWWRLRGRLAPGTQVVLLTPLTDDDASRFARRFEAYGHPVTVVSPDPTADRTPGHRLSRVARTLRITALRRAGIPVVDWPWADPVEAALARHEERWSR